MAVTINLDAAKAARAEILKDEEAPSVLFGGETFSLPFELPFGVFLRLAELKKEGADGDDALETMRTVMRSLFGDRTDEFLDLAPSLDDMLALVSMLVESYEVELPESSASSSDS